MKLVSDLDESQAAEDDQSPTITKQERTHGCLQPSETNITITKLMDVVLLFLTLTKIQTAMAVTSHQGQGEIPTDP